ncbi:hypothetical protein CDCA_CDCA12G3461 [Cyanidium caldarium]|uniref:Oxidoreductase FAD/NAD(P)-binding domain-containing protein n=1 Tax=Cyanidium caldarium TaxID=2771 RepID=A0AAV9IZ92_CYACA|nr:hypothetical protein CDCA_CDCA12G3461 [Cyanidium caldarium]
MRQKTLLRSERSDCSEQARILKLGGNDRQGDTAAGAMRNTPRSAEGHVPAGSLAWSAPLVWARPGHSGCALKPSTSSRVGKAVGQRSLPVRAPLLRMAVRSLPRPPGRYVETAEGDTLAAIAAKYGMPPEQVYVLNNKARNLEFVEPSSRLAQALGLGRDEAMEVGARSADPLLRPLRAQQRVFVPYTAPGKKGIRLSRVEPAESTMKTTDGRKQAPSGAAATNATAQGERATAKTASRYQVRVPAPTARVEGPARTDQSVRTALVQSEARPVVRSLDHVSGMASPDFFLGIFAVLVGFFAARFSLPRSNDAGQATMAPRLGAVAQGLALAILRAGLTVTMLLGIFVRGVLGGAWMAVSKARSLATTGLMQSLALLKRLGEVVSVVFALVLRALGAMARLAQMLAVALLLALWSAIRATTQRVCALWSMASSQSSALAAGIGHRLTTLGSVTDDGSVVSLPEADMPWWSSLGGWFRGGRDDSHAAQPWVSCVLRERAQLSDRYVRMRFDLPEGCESLPLLLGQRLEVDVQLSERSLWSDYGDGVVEPEQQRHSSGGRHPKHIRRHRIALATPRRRLGSFDIVVPVSRALRDVMAEASGGGDSSTVRREVAYGNGGGAALLQRPAPTSTGAATASDLDGADEFDESFLVALESLVEGVDGIAVRPAPDTELIYRRAATADGDSATVTEVAMAASGLGIVPCVRIAEEMLADSESSVGRVTIVYYNERSTDFILLDELERMTKRMNERLRLSCIWNENGQTGAAKLVPAMPAWSEGLMAIISGNEHFSREVWLALCDSGYPEDAITLV